MIRTLSKAPRPPRRRLARLALAASALGAGFGVLATAPTPASAASRPILKLASHGSLGKILVTASGMTVYVFTANSGGDASCTGACLSAWPAVTVAKGVRPKGGPGVTGLGTVSIGGKHQVTWNKHLLYTYALDTGPGVVNGNGVKEGTGTWWAATKKLVALTASSPKSSSPPSGGSSGGYGY
jgi:predicted lipoprotein with Yx(FWY)xxD motif